MNRGLCGIRNRPGLGKEKKIVFKRVRITVCPNKLVYLTALIIMCTCMYKTVCVILKSDTISSSNML